MRATSILQSAIQHEIFRKISQINQNILFHIQASRLSDSESSILKGFSKGVSFASKISKFVVRQYKLDLASTHGLRYRETRCRFRSIRRCRKNYWLGRTDRRLLIVSGEQSSIVRKRGNSSDVCGTRSTRRQTIRKIMELHYEVLWYSKNSNSLFLMKIY